MILLLILIALNIADIVTTVIGLKRGATEGNPVARKLLGPVPALPAMIGLKLALLAVLTLLLVYYPSWWPVGAAFCLYSAYVVWNNVRVIRGL